MNILSRSILCGALALLLAACGKKADDAAPLAFVPADTPYVFASLEPLPEAALEDRFRVIQPLWKPYFAQIDAVLVEAAAKAKDDAEKQAVAGLRAVLDEVRERDSLAKWKEIGFNLQARSALYGVGLAPVLRVELADADAFRAFIGRIETKLGKPLSKASVAGQDYWRFESAEMPLYGAMAIEGKHLVLTVLPKNASEAAQKELLGLVRPDRNMADGAALAALARERGYLPQGLGYLDITRVLDRLAGEHRGTDGEFAAALQLPSTPIDATCRAEIASVGAKLPRASFGYVKFDTAEQSMRMELDLDATVRSQLAATLVPIPGMAARDDALLDFALAVPVLKWKDFWSKQADAVTSAPYQCASFAKLNESFAEMKPKLDTTVPPPLSNLLGLRFTLDKLVLGQDGMPDTAQTAGRLLVASDNPLLMVSMAQLGLPALKDLRLAPDGKPVALPSGSLPQPIPLFVAANNSALALAAGSNAEAALPAYLAAPAGDGKTLLHVRVTGDFYGLYGELIDKLMSKGMTEHKELLDLQRQMYQRYRDWMAFTDITAGVGEHGLVFDQVTRFHPAK